MRKSNKKGAIMLMTAMLSTAIIGITAIVADIGYLYLKRNELQTAVNAGWLAGNDRLQKLRASIPILTNENKEEIKNHIIEVMGFNNFIQNSDNILSLDIKDNRNIELSAQSHVGLFFARMIKAETTAISAERSGKASTADTADIVPLTMSHGVIKWTQNGQISFQFFPKGNGFIAGQEYIIKPGQNSEESVLCQGIAGFAEKVTSEQYKKSLTYGYTKHLTINDKLCLACAGLSQETTEAIKNRGNNKKVIVPIVEPTIETANSYGISASMLPIYNLKSNNNTGEQFASITDAVKIIGFAEFELLEPSEYRRIGSDFQNGDSGSLGKITSGQIRGRFISYIVDPSEVIAN